MGGELVWQWTVTQRAPRYQAAVALIFEKLLLCDGYTVWLAGTVCADLTARAREQGLLPEWWTVAVDLDGELDFAQLHATRSPDDCSQNEHVLDAARGASGRVWGDWAAEVPGHVSVGSHFAHRAMTRPQ